ncbi:hypothetical protein SDC9_211527 [bioreactor metagenome]|uniref:Uncharacterized protein n=1 Tax=bioreactor metagenome TaxID=1076179 RepID=A0A645JJL8_9ZZZZ
MRSKSCGAIPMPVSDTRKSTRSWESSSARILTSPLSVNFNALEMRLRRICDTLLSSDVIGGRWRVPSKTSETPELLARSGLSIPRSAPNRSSMKNSAGRTVTLPASTLARSSRSLTRSERSWLARCMKRTCFSCSPFKSPST